MCDHENREAAMVVVRQGTPERHGRDGVWCDPCLVPLVKALNVGGLPTVASCCGHGKHPGKVALADGREMFILSNFETAGRAYDLLSDVFAEQDPSDAEVPMTNPERDRYRRIVEAQRKDICDLVRQLEDASRRASFWEAIATPAFECRVCDYTSDEYGDTHTHPEATNDGV